MSIAEVTAQTRSESAGRSAPDGEPERARSARRLTVLAVGTDDWAIEQVAGALGRSDHEVLRCHEPGEPSFPCNALIEGRTCPLDVGFDVVVTTRARPLPQATPGEFGVVCGVRHGAPLVVAGMTLVNPFAPWSSGVVDQTGDVVSACELVVAEQDAAIAGHAPEAAVIDLDEMRALL